jgi:hypothetical protein
VTTVSPEVRMSLLATGRFPTIFPAFVLRFPAGRSELKVLPVALAHRQRTKRNRHAEEADAEPSRAACHRHRARAPRSR